MIVVFEHDHREHNGRRWVWIPGLFRGVWNGRRTYRVWWGFWSLSYYSAAGLAEFFRYIEAGNTEWRTP